MHQDMLIQPTSLLTDFLFPSLLLTLLFFISPISPLHPLLLYGFGGWTLYDVTGSVMGPHCSLFLRVLLEVLWLLCDRFCSRSHGPSLLVLVLLVVHAGLIECIIFLCLSCQRPRLKPAATKNVQAGKLKPIILKPYVLTWCFMNQNNLCNSVSSEMQRICYSYRTVYCYNHFTVW